MGLIVRYCRIRSDSLFRPRFKKLSYTASATLVYQSPIGPLSASYTYYPDEETPFSFFINLGYILFNRESLK
jgi:outer membrane translocation and assembly module TamA